MSRERNHVFFNQAAGMTFNQAARERMNELEAELEALKAENKALKAEKRKAEGRFSLYAKTIGWQRKRIEQLEETER